MGYHLCLVLLLLLGDNFVNIEVIWASLGMICDHELVIVLHSFHLVGHLESGDILRGRGFVLAVSRPAIASVFCSRGFSAMTSASTATCSCLTLIVFSAWIGSAWEDRVVAFDKTSRADSQIFSAPISLLFLFIETVWLISRLNYLIVSKDLWCNSLRMLLSLLILLCRPVIVWIRICRCLSLLVRWGLAWGYGRAIVLMAATMIGTTFRSRTWASPTFIGSGLRVAWQIATATPWVVPAAVDHADFLTSRDVLVMSIWNV